MANWHAEAGNLLASLAIMKISSSDWDATSGPGSAETGTVACAQSPLRTKPYLVVLAGNSRGSVGVGVAHADVEGYVGRDLDAELHPAVAEARHVARLQGLHAAAEPLAWPQVKR